MGCEQRVVGWCETTTDQSSWHSFIINRWQHVIVAKSGSSEDEQAGWHHGSIVPEDLNTVFFY